MLKDGAAYVEEVTRRLRHQAEQDKQKPRNQKTLDLTQKCLGPMFVVCKRLQTHFIFALRPKAKKPRWPLKHWAFMKEKKAVVQQISGSWLSLAGEAPKPGEVRAGVDVLC